MAVALESVTEPDLLRGLGELGMLREVELRRRTLWVVLSLPVAGWPVRDELARRVARAAGEVPGFSDVRVEMAVMSDAERDALAGKLSSRYAAPGSRTRVVGISSGKGGVGKSSVTVNLAVALAARGHEVGLLDADVYGFSVPKMLGVTREPVAIGELLVPPVVHGVRCLSMGFFVPDEQPVVWRGPMLHKALEQFLNDAYWGEPDYLLIDMPPGTGDVALSLAQYLPRAEILVVTTPQPAAQRVAQRSAFAARSLKLPVRGVIENLSWFTADDGRRYELFGAGGGDGLAESLGVPLLARIPLVPAVREGGDTGSPAALADPSGEAALAFDSLAEAVSGLGPARIYRRELEVR
ncbi:MAG TPA: P-loop NTPase [Acidimicrobiales bacterium]|nr:P-loop NTPase [Acidimicrobiales bacterium]